MVICLHAGIAATCCPLSVDAREESVYVYRWEEVGGEGGARYWTVLDCTAGQVTVMRVRLHFRMGDEAG